MTLVDNVVLSGIIEKLIWLMKYIILLSLLSIGKLFAQQVDYNTIILPDGLDNIDISEKLVRLAWKNYPANTVAQHEVLIAQHNIGVAGSRWLSSITLSGNLNEFNINPESNPNINNFYPRYNIAVSIPLGIFLEAPKSIKIAKEEYEISRLSLNELKLTLRAEVLIRHRNYLTEKALLQMQTILIENEENAFSLVEARFVKGEISIEEYNTASQSLNNSRVNLIKLESSYEIAKINLEMFIGVALESIE
jgi:outer membrane protein TolC